jgi:hypothetical protein
MFPLYDMNPTTRWAGVNYAIIAINTLLLLWSLSLPPGEYDKVVAHHGFIPARLAQLRDPRVIVRAPVGTETVQPWFGPPQQVPVFINLSADRHEIIASFITCMFLHAGWLHLLGNMWFLFLFGDNIEDRLGHLPYLLFYLFGGIAASLVDWATNPASVVPVIGASGAIAAVLGAYAVTFPWARVRTLIFIIVFVTFVDLPALAVLGLWFAMQLFEGVGEFKFHLGGGVAFWAHVGGFAIGAILMPLLAAIIPPAIPPEAPADHYEAY